MDFSKQFTWAKLRNLYPVLVCIVLSILALNIRWRTLYDFCFIFTDNDQLLLWDAARDMHHGIFHEPCFYGQSYNPLVEPLFAQPFLIFGIPLRLALPLTSWIFGIFPYLLLGWGFLKEKKYLTLAFVGAYLLWLPVEFHAIDSMPRGFTPACAFAAMGIYLVLFTEQKNRFFWFGFLSLIALTISQNCIFMVVPVAVYIWLWHFKSLRFYLQTAVGFLIALPLPLFIYWFYHSHPAYNVHIIEFTFGFDTFKDTLSEIETYVNFLTPDAKNKLMTVTLGYVFFAILCLIKKNFRAGIGVMSGLTILYFSFWFDKMEDGTGSMYFSSVRMLLGVPLAIIIFSYWAESSFKIKFYRNLLPFLILTFLLAIGITSSSERNRYFKASLYHPSNDTDVVPGRKVDSVVAYCNRIQNICKTNHSDLVIIENYEVVADYLCPALDYPFTILRPSYERRTWDMQKEDTTSRENFIYLPYPEKMSKQYKANIDIKPTNDPIAFLVTTHGRKVFNILKDMGIEVRPH